MKKDYSFLLNRAEHQFHEDKIDEALRGKKILITGAGGSIGSALARRILSSPAAFVGLVGHSEAPIFNLLQEFSNSAYFRIGYRIISVSDPNMAELIGDWEPEVILHAAAHKHVNLMESQPAEALRNNTEATLNLAELAIQSSSVRKFVFISTDKAVRPTSVMGASKRIAETALIYRYAPFATVCRFGNVLGSAGSFVEIVERNFREGRPVKITDEQMKRYFITAKEAVGLVLTAGLLESGDRFTLDMGEPIPIMDIATKLAPPGAKFETGKPGSGEKFDEDLLASGEVVERTGTAGVLRILAAHNPEVEGVLARVRQAPERIVAEAQTL